MLRACVFFFTGGRLLVGAPCEAIDLSSNRLNLELVWQRLVEFRRCKLPMGCATDGDHKALREVGRGLFIYDCVRSFESRGGERGVKDGHFFFTPFFDQLRSVHSAPLAFIYEFFGSCSHPPSYSSSTLVN